MNTDITVVADITGMFANSNLSALWNPNLLANFPFWTSAVFYVGIILTLAWVLLSIWGWKRDLRDIERLER